MDLIEELRAAARPIPGKPETFVVRSEMFDEAADEIERLRGVEAAVEKLLEWVGPLAGDNCDPISAEIEVRTVAEVRAAIVASRSTGAADAGEGHG